MLDTLAQATSPAYRDRLQLHEAAHFLVAYLMGILPKVRIREGEMPTRAG